jgi:GTPase SAR1 family protein
MKGGSFSVWDPASGLILVNAIKCPGLTPHAREIERLARELPRDLSVFSYKLRNLCLWVVFLGGTGTGKSTLFNAFCEKALSETGVERPKTLGPIAYAHDNCPLDDGFPFPGVQTKRLSPDDSLTGPLAGSPGHLSILTHHREKWSGLIIVDTPDLDSVEPLNRQIAQDLYLLSDTVVFVTSQEKYADDVPYQFLRRVLKDKKNYFFLLNKAQKGISREEVGFVLKNEDIEFRENRMWIIPLMASHSFHPVSRNPVFREFVGSFLTETSSGGSDRLRNAELSRRCNELKADLSRLLEFLKEEEREVDRWSDQLRSACETIVRDLIEDHKGSFENRSREHLKTEIRKLFNRYDILAGPRKVIREILLTPLRLIGLGRQKSERHRREDLLKAGRNINLMPIKSSLERLHRLVIESLSPSDETSLLFGRLREPGMMLTEKEIEERVREEQESLVAWLDETFLKLSKGIPRSKKWGIYSTSILWGILILSFETAVGGGFTVLDAALDSALAPFVTKGAVELFAYHEIRKIAGELVTRYQEGLVSLVTLQRERYETCIRSLLPPREILESLQSLSAELSEWRPGEYPKG